MPSLSRSHPLRAIVSLFILLTLAAACAGAPSTATSVPPTGTPRPEVGSPTAEASPTGTPTPLSIATSTATSPPPTETPTLMPSPTSPTPTSTATPTSTETATPDIPSEKLGFLTADGVDLSGTLFGDGEIAVMFLHQGRGNATQNSWKPFAQLAASQGFAALTIDFRGRGHSGGTVQEGTLPVDARAAAEYLQGRGFQRLVCIGAGTWGGWPCTLLALEGSVEAIAILSSPMAVGPTGLISVEQLAGLTVPKLYIYGEKDYEGVAENMAEAFRVSAEPKEQVVYDSAARGTNLFRSPFAEDLTQRLLDFLQSQR